MKVTFSIDSSYGEDDFLYGEDVSRTEVTYLDEAEYPTVVTYESGKADIDMSWTDLLKTLITVTERAYHYEFDADKLHKMIDEMKKGK
jgi:hypothetical protein